MAKFGKGAKVLRLLRQENLLTVETLAEAIDCTIEHVRAIHSGHANLTVEHLRILLEKEIFSVDQISALKRAYGYGIQGTNSVPSPGGNTEQQISNNTVVIESSEKPQRIDIGINIPEHSLSPGSILNFTFNLTVIVKILVLACLGTAAYTALRSVGLWIPAPWQGCADCPPPPSVSPLLGPRLIRSLDNATSLFAFISLILLIITLVKWFLLKAPQRSDKSTTIKASILSILKYALAVAAMVLLRFVILPSYDLLPHGELAANQNYNNGQLYIAVTGPYYLFYIAILIPAYYLLFLIIKDLIQKKL